MDQTEKACFAAGLRVFRWLIQSIGKLNRSQNVVKGALVGAKITVRADSYEVKQIAIAQLRRGDRDDLVPAGRFVGVAEADCQCAAAVKGCALIIGAGAQARVALLETINKLVRGLLQIVALRSCSAKAQPMCENTLAIRRTIGAFGSKPDGSLFR